MKNNITVTTKIKDSVLIPILFQEIVDCRHYPFLNALSDATKKEEEQQQQQQLILGLHHTPPPPTVTNTTITIMIIKDSVLIPILFWEIVDRRHHPFLNALSHATKKEEEEEQQ